MCAYVNQHVFATQKQSIVFSNYRFEDMHVFSIDRFKDVHVLRVNFWAYVY